ncbi:MAG: family 43 glycosylhydrolase, partial [Acidimicrobiia bacterium]
LAVAVIACGPPIGKPAVGQVPNAPTVFDNADTSVLVVGTTWYMFGSTNNMRVPVRILSSPGGTLAQSQQAWAQHPRDAMPTMPAWVDPGESEIWAPNAININGTYFLYFAARHGGFASDENNDQCIGRAGSATPEGPYAPEPAPIYCGGTPEGAIAGMPPSNSWGRGALDPEVFRAPDGSLFLIAAVSRTQKNIVSLPLTPDGLVEGGVNAEGAVLAAQRLMWHDGVVDDQLGAEAFLENPSMIAEPLTGTYLLFYSAGQWYTPNYVTGIARCKKPTGPCTLAVDPFLINGNGRTGIGGLTAFTDETGGKWVAYASWQAGLENQVGSVGQYKRQTHLQRLLISVTDDPKEQEISLG